MKFIANRKELANAIKIAASVIANRNMLPVLGNVLIESSDASIQITGTNLEQRISAKCNADIEREGKTTIPAKKLIALLDSMNDSFVTIDSNESDHAEITCGTARFKLLGLPADDYPVGDEKEYERTIVIATGELKRIINNVSYAISTQDTRQTLRGMLLDVLEDGNVCTAATDGKRLAVAWSKSELTGVPGDAIIPLASIQTLCKMSGEKITLKLNQNHMTANGENMQLSSKLITGTYPNYKQVIPSEFAFSSSIPTDAFQAKLSLIQTMSDGSIPVAITIEADKILLDIESSAIGNGHDEIEAECNILEPQRITVSPLFLMQALKCAGEKTVLKFNSPTAPIMLECGAETIAVIMPVRK